MIKIVLTDDHPMVRRGVRMTLEDDPQLQIVAEAGSGAELMEVLAKTQADVLVLDVSLPDRSGMDLLKDAKAGWPDLGVLIYTRFPENQYAVRALKAGASGFLNKSCDPAELLVAIKKIAEGGTYVSPEVGDVLSAELRRQNPQRTHADLSDRELEIFGMLVAGRTPTEIADQLRLSVKTVSAHRIRIVEKLGVESLAGLVRYALENKLEFD
jgi:two-component system, NarL family, invasion response regulator UvrY